MATKAAPKPRVTLTGGLQWRLPGVAYVVQWWGPQSGLFLCPLDAPGSLPTRIDFKGHASLGFATAADAKAAFIEFFNRKGI